MLSIALWKQICAQRGRLLKEIELRLSSFSEGQLEGSMETLKTSSNVEKDLIFCLLLYYKYLLEAAIAWYSITNVNEKVSVRNVQNDSCYQHLAKTINFWNMNNFASIPLAFVRVVSLTHKICRTQISCNKGNGTGFWFIHYRLMTADFGVVWTIPHICHF